MTHMLAAPRQAVLIGVAGWRSGEDHHTAGTGHLDAKLFGAGRVVGVQPPVQGFTLRALGFQRLCEPGGQRSSASEVMTNNQVPASASRSAGSSRCCQSIVSRRSASTRWRSLLSVTPLPIRSPRTISKTVPCSSNTSRSASPAPVGCGHSAQAVAGISGGP